MTKEEKIKEAYGADYDTIKDFLNSEGWVCCLWHKFIFLIDDLIYDRKGNGTRSEMSRPKTLRGIENNNGWTKIENENDLPKIIGSYFTYNGRELDVYHFEHNDFWKKQWKAITHFQKISDPIIPIY